MADNQADIAAKLLGISNQLVTSLIEIAREVRFDKENPQHLSVICLYASILEVAGSINVLVEEKHTTSVPILLRTLLEAFASLRCCCIDPEHFKVMGAGFLVQKRRLLKSALENPDNPYLKPLARASDLEKDIAEIERQTAELEEKGTKAINIYQEFKKGDLLAEYHSLYWILCMQAHNNVSALEDRHLEKDGETYEVTMYKEENPADTVRNVDSMCGLLMDASARVHGILETGLDSRVADVAKGLMEIRAAYSAKKA